MVYYFSKKSKKRPTWYELVHCIRRNFGGLPNTKDPVQVFEKYLPRTSEDPEVNIFWGKGQKY